MFRIGGKKLKSHKVALSLATTFFSAITILGTPVEYYSYGTMFTYFVLCYLITIILARVKFYMDHISPTYLLASLEAVNGTASRCIIFASLEPIG